MELQATAKDQYNNSLVYVVLFEQIDIYENPFLYQLGFGSKKLYQLETL